MLVSKPQKSLSMLFVRLLKERNRGDGAGYAVPQKYIAEMLQDEGQRTRIGAKPTVILVVGVNGVGKTTTIGKLANYFHLFKYKVMLAAGDTFRAAAAEQLQIWGERAGCEVIRHEEGADPAAVVLTLSKPLLPAMSTYFLLTLPDGCIIKPI